MFKALAELGEEDEVSASAPLLSVSSGGRATSSEEERELWESEGPNSGMRGTLMDGIANVRLCLFIPPSLFYLKTPLIRSKSPFFSKSIVTSVGSLMVKRTV